MPWGAPGTTRTLLATCVGLVAAIGCKPKLVANGDPEPAVELAGDDVPASVAAPAPDVAADPWSGCTIDAECGLSDDPTQFAVCEANACVRWTSAQMWTWATARAPELTTLHEANTLADASWIASSGTTRVFVDARQLLWPKRAKCVPIDLEWHEGSLVADIPEVLGTKPKAKNAWFYTLRLSGGVDVLGPGRATSDDGSEAIGGLQSFGRGLRVTDDSLRYTTTRFTADVVCSGTTVERPGCEPAVCGGCTEVAVRKRSQDGDAGYGGIASSKLRQAEGVCEPCPVDAFGPILTRLDAAVTGRTFVDDHGDDDGPVFHRRLADCTAALKQRTRRIARERRPL